MLNALGGKSGLEQFKPLGRTVRSIVPEKKNSNQITPMP